MIRPVRHGFGLVTAIVCINLWPFTALAQEEAVSTSPRHAKLQALNKVTARVTELEAPLHQPIAYEELTITAKTCWHAPQSKLPEQAVLLEVTQHNREKNTDKLVFSGWMFASSPALSAMEHPVYDISLISCQQ